jgi:S1-C subfamily serine protease
MTRSLLNLKRLVLGLTLTLLWLVATNTVRANPEIYKNTMPAMAWVVSPIDNDKAMFGAGVVIDVEKKQVVTAYHIVEERADVIVFFPVDKDHKYVTDADYYLKNRLGVRGKVVAKDAKKDLAVLAVEKLPDGVKALTLAKASPKAEETVHVVGNSRKYDQTLWNYREGMVKDVGLPGFELRDGNGEALRNVAARTIAIDVAADHGDSGGPVLNNRGEVVAITSAIIPGKMTCFGIDAAEVRSVLSSVKGEERVEDDEYEAKCREMLDTLRQATKLLRTVKDKPSARKAAPKLKELLLKLKEVTREVMELEEDMTAQEKDQSFAKYKAEADSVLERFKKQCERVNKIPGVEEILRDSFKVLADLKDKPENK